MTTRKENAVMKYTYLAKFPATFAAVMKAAKQELGLALETMTARQIAAVIEFGYQQHTHGEMNAE